MIINSFPDYKHLLQENYVDTNFFLILLKLVSKILCHAYISKKKMCLYSTYSVFLVINVCNQGKILCSPCNIYLLQVVCYPVAVVILHVQNMKLVTIKCKLGGLHEKHVVAPWNLENHLSICF